MVNPITEVLAYLNLQEELTDLTTQFHGGYTYPPEEYIPGTMAIVFNSRGGTYSYDRTLRMESFGFKCYGKDEVEVFQLGEVLTSVMDDKFYGNIRATEIQATGFPTQEPVVLWWYSSVYILITFKSGRGA